MQTIKLKNIQVYAYHGCLPQETKIGSDYLVNITLSADLSTSCLSDNLKDTVDYCSVFDIVKYEMAIPAKLLEHVAHRIQVSLLKKHPEIKTLKIEVSKLNPPMNGNVGEVSVTLNY